MTLISVLRFWPLLLVSLLAAACGQTDAPSDDADETPVEFTMGESIADSTIAVIVEVGAQADTIATEVFFQQYAEQAQGNPFVMADSLQDRELRRSIAEGFVYQAVLGALAKQETGLDIDSSLAEQQIGFFRQQTQQSGTTLEAELEAAGMTLDELRERLYESLVLRAMADRLAERATPPTEAEIATFREEQAEEVSLQHMVFYKMPGLSPTGRDSVRQVAEAVLDSVNSGVSFEELARRNSQDGNAANGGNIGFVSRAAQMPEPIEEAAFALRDSGDVAPVIESPVGYHLLRLTGRQTGVPMDTTRARQMLLSERQGDAVRSAIEDAIQTRGVIVRVNPDVVRADLNDRYDADAQ